MNKPSRMLWVILFGVPLFLVLPVALIGSSVVNHGMITIEVHERGGVDLGMQVPAALVPVALRLAPAVVIDEIECEISGEAEEALRIAQRAWKEISRCPDGVFVDVRTNEEIITISKEGGALKILIDTPDESVRVSVPAHTVSSVLSFLT